MGLIILRKKNADLILLYGARKHLESRIDMYDTIYLSDSWDYRCIALSIGNVQIKVASDDHVGGRELKENLLKIVQELNDKYGL